MTTNVLNTNINEVEYRIVDHAKDITTQEFDKLSAENFSARLTQTYLINKTNFGNKLISFNRKNYLKYNKIFRSSEKAKYSNNKTL